MCALISCYIARLSLDVSIFSLRCQWMNNLEMMRKRLDWQGGIHQEDRMIKGKWQTLQRVLKYSYQASTIQKVQPYNEVLPYDWEPESLEDSALPQYPYDRALINSDKLKQDYDDKILSIDYQAGYQPGDVFEWKKTGTYWLIYLQQLSEDAYFRGEIRRCRYRIKFKDKDDNWVSTWAAIRGPVETQIDSIQKNQQRVDEPNWSLNILMPCNEHTKAAFERYSRFILDGRAWQVKVADSISVENIIEISAEEYYVNESKDDMENEIADGLVIEPIDPTPESGILGETFIKPKIAETYSVEEPNGKWTILENVPAIVTPSGNLTATVTWNKVGSGQFTLQWEKNDIVLQKTIVVESLY